MKRINRVKKHAEFAEIEKTTSPCRTRRFAVYSKPNELGYTRIGITVSKKNGNAVARNRIKRQIRAMINEVCDLRLSRDVIIIARVAYDTNHYHEGLEELRSLLATNGEKNLETKQEN